MNLIIYEFVIDIILIKNKHGLLAQYCLWDVIIWRTKCSIFMMFSFLCLVYIVLYRNVNKA